MKILFLPLLLSLATMPAMAEGKGVGNYVGGGVTEVSDEETEAKIWGRYRFAKGWGGEFSFRPYSNLILSDTGSFLASGGAVLTHDRSLAHVLSKSGRRVSTVNIYGGLGAQGIVSGLQESGSVDSILGSLQGTVAVLGLEARLTENTVSFVDLKVPVTAVADAEFKDPLVSIGIGFKF